jgi:hypothetical protein
MVYLILKKEKAKAKPWISRWKDIRSETKN